MPLYSSQSPLPSWLDPKTESVFDSAPVRALKQGVGLLGFTGDPKGDLEQTLAPGSMEMASPLVTIYKNAAERAAGTMRFQQLIKQIPGFSEAGEAFARAYPRVAAHINPVYEHTIKNLPNAKAAMSIGVPGEAVSEPLNLTVSHLGLDAVHRDPSKAIEILGHEGTHAAQKLSNKDMNQLYTYANAITGYEGNPFEISPRLKGAKMRLPEAELPTYNAIRGLKDVLGGIERPMPLNKKMVKANAIEDILERRSK